MGVAPHLVARRFSERTGVPGHLQLIERFLERLAMWNDKIFDTGQAGGQVVGDVVQSRDDTCCFQSAFVWQLFDLEPRVHVEPELIGYRAENSTRPVGQRAQHEVQPRDGRQPVRCGEGLVEDI